jgi:hypothetical protein
MRNTNYLLIAQLGSEKNRQTNTLKIHDVILIKIRNAVAAVVK